MIGLVLKTRHCDPEDPDTFWQVPAKQPGSPPIVVSPAFSARMTGGGALLQMKPS